ncbi:Ig-like domain-containing protein [soil metagenome]
MKKIFLIILIFAGHFVSAQTAAKWENLYGQNGNEYGYRVRTCVDQGYIVAGSTSSTGISDGYVVRVDSLGLVMWYKYLIGNNVDILRSISQLPDSGYVLAGYSNSTGTHGGYDGWVVRMNQYGDTLWTKYIGTPDWDFFYDVAPTYDGGFILCGGTYGIGAGEEDMWFVKIDANGDTLWTKTYGGIKTDEARSIIETGDSLLAVAGFSYSLGDSLGDSWILRMDEVGDTIWTRTLQLRAASADKAFGIADISVYGRLMVVGETSSRYGDPDGYYRCFTYAGDTLFTDIHGGAGSIDNFSGVVTRPNASFAVVGTTENVSGGGHGDFYFYNDHNGGFITSFGTFQPEAGYSIDITHDDGYILCGYSQGFNSFVPQVMLIKCDTTGFSTGLIGIREEPTLLSNAATTVFPNPANEKATITYDAFKSVQGKLTLELFDLSGRIVMQIPFSQWQMLSAKNFSCTLETASLNEGMYQYVIADDAGTTCAGKIVVSHE